MIQSIPAAALSQHIAVLGKTGSGKTSTAKLAIEQVVADGARVCIIDPLKSDWWGLVSSSDGKRSGLPFTILGGPHGHLPLHPHAGKAIGEVVANRTLPLSIIDMADFGPGGHTRFFADFASVLMKKMRGVLYLVIEEAHEFAPKERAGVEGESMSVYYAKKIATAGRTKGIRMIVCTQRTQALHNAVLGSCDTIIAHRFTAPADQEPIVKWLKSNVKDRTRRDEIADSLSSIKTGTGWLCSGEAGIFELRQFPRIKTYDNTATPNDDSTAVDVKTTQVDVEKLRAVIGDAVREAEGSDPKKLKERITELEQKLWAGNPAGSAHEISQATIEGRKAGHDEGYAAAMNLAKGEAQRILAAHEAFARTLQSTAEWISSGGTSSQVQAAPSAAPRSASTLPPRNSGTAARSNGAGDQSLGKAERALLTVLAQCGSDGCSRTRLAIMSTYSPTSSTFANALGALRSKGYSSKSGEPIFITPEGIRAVGDWEPLPVGGALIKYWCANLGKAERTMLEILTKVYPQAVSKDALAEQANYSVTSSTFANALGKLRTLDLVNRGPTIKANEAFFQ